MSVNWAQLRPVKQQSEAYRWTGRFACLLAGRGSGKSEISKRKIVRSLPLVGGGNYAYALPTYNQAKKVAWQDFKRLVPREWVKKESESDLYIETVYGSTLFLLGMDKAHRAEGIQYKGVVVDESSDQKPGTISKTFMPALTTHNGWLWAIGVPKSYGVGAKEYRQYCEWGFKGEKGWKTFHWKSSDVMSQEALQATADALDAAAFAELMDAVWGETGGGVFHAFTESANIRDVTYNPNLPIVIGSDFNVDPMSWVLGHKMGNQFWVFDELYLRNTNTQATLDYVWDKYKDHQQGWCFIGDATSAARKTAASASDYVQIITDTRFDEYRDKEVLYPRSNPARADRFASTNALLKSKSGNIRLLINPRCTHLIADLRARSYKPGTREPDDSGDIGHITDALGYVIHRLWPITAMPQPTNIQIYSN